MGDPEFPSQKSPSGHCSYNVGNRIEIAMMTDDLLIEILARLPLESLFRFKCVCKAWRSLISDDYLRSRLPLVTSAVLCPCDTAGLDNKGPKYACVSRGGLNDCPLDFFPFLGDSSLIDSCNGLLLYRSCLQAAATSTAFYVVNPTTRRWAALPKPAKGSQLLSVLAFDPGHSPHFKVVCFTKWRTQGAEVEVFSSEAGGCKWAEHVVHWGLDTDAMLATMRYFDGVLHVLARPNNIVAIDLTKMAAQKMELPENVGVDGFISKCRGSLHYTQKDGNIDQLRVWMLEDANCGRWVLKHCVDSVRVMSAGRGFRVLALHPEREVVYFWVPGKLMCYDLGEQRLEEVCDLLGKEREEANYLVQICLFPFSRYVSDCLTN